MKHPESERLFQYWDSMRGGSLAPARRSIDPAEIAPLLPEVFVLEASADGSHAFRLAGTAVCSRHGRELRGERFTSIWNPDDRRQVGILLEGCRADTHGVVIGSRAATHGYEVAFETLVLPMLEPHGGVERLIGVQSPSSRPWPLGAHPLSFHDLASMRVLWGGRDNVRRMGEAPLSDAIEFSRRGRIPEGMPARSVGHLRVIEGGAGA